MIVILRAAQLLLVLVLIFIFPVPASAQLFPSPCTSAGQCPDGFICRTGFLNSRVCLFEFCNADAECSRRGSLCTNGICRIPATAGGGGGGGSGIGPSGVGGRCGPRRLGGGVIKSVGCQHGLQCTHGTCQLPPS